MGRGSGGSRSQGTSAYTGESDRRVPAFPPDTTSLIKRIARQLPILDAIRVGAELYGSPRLNAFLLFDPDENALSRIVGNLLDPSGTHGQGLTFINALLVTLGLPRAGANDLVRVQREASTDEGRRIDLVIETPRVLLGIENKPWAGQQPKQLRDYVDALRSRARGRTFALVFLSDQEPETAKDEVIALPFASANSGPSLASILEFALIEVKASRVREHIEEFLQYINWQFGDGAMIDDSEKPYIAAIVAEFISAEHRKSIAAVMLAQENLHGRILNEIGAHICQELNSVANDFEIVDAKELSDALAERYSPWQIRRCSWPRNLAIAIEANKPNCRDIYFGVRAGNPNDAEVRSSGEGCAAYATLEAALRAIGGGGKTKWWAWWKFAAIRSWGPEFAARMILNSPTGHAEDHPEIVELSKAIVELAAVLDEALISA